MVSGSAGRLSAAVSGGAFVAGIVPWGYSINRVTSSASFRPRCALIRHENIFVRSNCIVLIGGGDIPPPPRAGGGGGQKALALPPPRETTRPTPHPPPRRPHAKAPVFKTPNH